MELEDAYVRDGGMGRGGGHREDWDLFVAPTTEDDKSEVKKEKQDKDNKPEQSQEDQTKVEIDNQPTE